MIAADLAVAEAVSRVLMVVGMVLTVGALVVSVRALRRESPVRPGVEVARIGLSLAVAAVVGLLVGVSTPLWLALLAGIGGLGLGLGQGVGLEATVRDGSVFVRKGAVAVICWGLGTVAMQGAGLANRTGAFRVGQAVAVAGAALGVGVMLGRRGPVEEAWRRAGAVTAGAATLAVALAVLPALDVLAQGEQTDLDDLVGGGGGAEGVCDVIPDQLGVLGQYAYGGDGGPSACNGQDTENFATVVRNDSESEAEALYDEFAARAGADASLGIGEESALAEPTFDGDDYNAVARRGPYTWEVGGEGPEATIVDLAEIIDDNVRSTLGEDVTSSDSDPTPEPTPDPTLPPEPDVVLPPTGEDADAADTGPVEEATSEPSESSAFWDTGDITTDEGLAAAIAIVLAALAMGVLSLSEAGAELSSLFAAAGRTDRSTELLSPFAPDDALAPAGEDEPGTFEPLDGTAPPSADDGVFEPLDHGDPGGFTGAEGDAEEVPAGAGPGLAGSPHAGTDWAPGDGGESPGLDEPPVGDGPPDPEGAPDPQPVPSPADGGGSDLVDGSAETTAGQDDPTADPATDPSGGPDIQVDGVGDVRLDDREIDDMVRWGRENNRPVDDIQNDLDWRNRARGGTGAVPIPGDVRSIHDPDFGVITDEGDAIDRFRHDQSTLGLLEERDRELRERWDELQTRRAKYRGLEEAFLIRGAAATKEALDVLGEYDERIGALDDEIREILRSGRLAEREEFGAYDAARHRERWETERHRIPRLREQIAQLEVDRTERLANMHSTAKGTPIEESSLFNRPRLVLDALDREQDDLMGEFRRLKEHRQFAEGRIDDFLRRNGKDP